MNTEPRWVSQGKTVKQLIQELQSFEDQSLEVRISIDSGETSLPISIVVKSEGTALLKNCEEQKSIKRHG